MYFQQNSPEYVSAYLIILYEPELFFPHFVKLIHMSSHQVFSLKKKVYIKLLHRSHICITMKNRSKSKSPSASARDPSPPPPFLLLRRSYLRLLLQLVNLLQIKATRGDKSQSKTHVVRPPVHAISERRLPTSPRSEVGSQRPSLSTGCRR